MSHEQAIRVMLSQFRSDRPFWFWWLGGDDVTEQPLLQRKATVGTPIILVSKSVMIGRGAPPISTMILERQAMRDEDLRFVNGYT